MLPPRRSSLRPAPRSGRRPSSRHLHRGARLCRIAAAVAVALAAREARADDPAVTVRELDPATGAAVKVEEKSLTYVNLGPSVSFVDAANLPATWSIGLEGSLNHYGVERVFAFGYGGFAQLQLITGKDFRGDLGGQVNAGPAGIELGLGYRQGDGAYASTVSLHAGAFLSVGYLYLSFRISPELFALGASAGQAGFGLETAFTVGIKVPITVQGRDPTGYAIQASGHAW